MADAGLRTLGQLVGAAIGLGARDVAGWSEAEAALVSSHPDGWPPGPGLARGLRPRHDDDFCPT